MELEEPERSIQIAWVDEALKWLTKKTDERMKGLKEVSLGRSYKKKNGSHKKQKALLKKIINYYVSIVEKTYDHWKKREISATR